MSAIGHEVSHYNAGQTEEDVCWLGKPWRRIELLVIRHFYKGEEVGKDRDLTLHFGVRRIGLSFTFVVHKGDYLDYSDEPHQ